MGILVLSLAFVCVYECVRYVLVRVCVVVSYIWHKRVVFDAFVMLFFNTCICSVYVLLHVFHSYHVCMATQLVAALRSYSELRTLAIIASTTYTCTPK